jgi:hypothetical protein
MIPPPSDAPIAASDEMVEDQATFVQPLAMILAARHDGGPVGAAQRLADHRSRHPPPPFCGSFGISSQDAQVKDTRSKPPQKAIHGGSVSMEVDRQAALQGGRGDETIRTI